MATVISFDTLAFAKELETAGVPASQAEAHAKALSTALRQVETTMQLELATKQDLKELEYRMVIKTGGMILAGIGILFGLMRAWPLPVQYVPPPQQMVQPVPLPSTTTPPR